MHNESACSGKSGPDRRFSNCVAVSRSRRWRRVHVPV